MRFPGAAPNSRRPRPANFHRGNTYILISPQLLTCRSFSSLIKFGEIHKLRPKGASSPLSDNDRIYLAEKI